MASFEPTATIFPPAIATACATESLASTVRTVPLTSTRSAGRRRLRAHRARRGDGSERDDEGEGQGAHESSANGHARSCPALREPQGRPELRRRAAEAGHDGRAGGDDNLVEPGRTSVDEDGRIVMLLAAIYAAAAHPAAAGASARGHRSVGAGQAGIRRLRAERKSGTARAARRSAAAAAPAATRAKAARSWR